MVALLGHQQAVMRRARAEQHADLLPVGREAHDIVMPEVVVFLRQEAEGGIGLQLGGSHR
ncbi:hypothetical protein D9M68_913320 [compost metagenome]